MSGSFLFVHINEWAPFRSLDTIPVSLGYILAALKKRGYDGAIVGDYKDRPLTGATFREIIFTLRPAIIGFTVYAESIDRVRFWARFAKFLRPEIIIVVGGPQITFMPGEALLQMEEIDLFCRGDGEVILPNIAACLEQGKPLNRVAGLCLLDHGQVFETGKPAFPMDLDQLPSPYLDGTLDVCGKDQVILFTSRGCSANCSFCYTPRASDRTIRFHSIERVVAEIGYLNRKGVLDYWFADPNFASSRERLEELCLALIRQVPGIGFWCQARYHLLDKSMLSLLRKAGAHTIAFGLESSQVSTLKAINKPLDPEGLSRAVKLSQDAGLKVELFTLFGLPGDSLESSIATLNYVRDHQVEIEGNSISQQFHLFFGVPINDNPQSYDISLMEVTRPAYHSPCRDFHTSRMASREIRKMSLLWRANRTDFEDCVANSQDLFNVAGFLTRHFDELEDSPQRDILLSKIYLTLDETAAAARCLVRLRDCWPENKRCREISDQPLVAYRSKRRAIAGSGSRIIFDCRGMDCGSIVPGTEQFYQMAVIGNNMLLESFEQGVIGVKSSSATQFDVSFPKDYGNANLAGRTIPFQVFLHQVLDPVVFANPEEMLSANVRNMYRFDNLYSLKKHNENLYYMVLRDSVLHSQSGNLNDIFALFDYNLKLGFMDKALELAYTLPREPSIMGHIGRILQVNDYAADAMEFLDFARDSSAEMENQRIRAYMKLQRYEEAEVIAANPLLVNSLETLDLKVKLAALRGLPLSTYLQRMESFLDIRVKMMAAQP
jgi:anaerobic magnesium-protoporphyrin IX monomethyl ester cyclase